MISHSTNPSSELLEDLFEEVPRPIIEQYESMEGVLEAVASRRKVMEWVHWPVEAIEECYADYIDFLHMAAAKKLTILQIPDDTTLGVPLVGVYALYPENLWRATAHASLLTVYRKELRWTKEAEDMQSYLLGYTDDERRIWHEYNSWRQLGWNGLTIYFLMNRDSCEGIQALASRCIDPALADQGIVAVSPSWGMGVKKDGLARLSSGTFLARAAVPHAFLEALFGPPSSRPQPIVQARSLTGEVINDVNRALISSLQFLTSDGWR